MHFAKNNVGSLHNSLITSFLSSLVEECFLKMVSSRLLLIDLTFGITPAQCLETLLLSLLLSLSVLAGLALLLFISSDGSAVVMVAARSCGGY